MGGFFVRGIDEPGDGQDLGRSSSDLGHWQSVEVRASCRRLSLRFRLGTHSRKDVRLRTLVLVGKRLQVGNTQTQHYGTHAYAHAVMAIRLGHTDDGGMAVGAKYGLVPCRGAGNRVCCPGCRYGFARRAMTKDDRDTLGPRYDGTRELEWAVENGLHLWPRNFSLFNGGETFK